MNLDALLAVGQRLGEAVVDPSRWPRLIDEIARHAGATGGALLQTDVRTPDVPRSPGVDDAFSAYFAEGWHQRDMRATLGVPLLMRGAPVICERDIVSPDVIHSSTFYNECLRRYRVPWFAGLGFRADSALWVLSIQRQGHQGIFEPEETDILARLVPRLTEAATLATVVGRQCLLGVINALDLVAQPAIALDRLGAVLDTNASASALFDDEFRVNRRALRFRDAIARAKFERFVDQMRTTPEIDALTVDPILVRRTARAPMVMKVLPVDGPARNPFLGARAILTLSELSRSKPLAEGMLQRLFGLTPAEERLSQHLALGLSLDEAADALGIVKETARNQLKSIFNKTETHRQSKLLALLTKL